MDSVIPSLLSTTEDVRWLALYVSIIGIIIGPAVGYWFARMNTKRILEDRWSSSVGEAAAAFAEACGELFYAHRLIRMRENGGANYLAAEAAPKRELARTKAASAKFKLCLLFANHDADRDAVQQACKKLIDDAKEVSDAECRNNVGDGVDGERLDKFLTTLAPTMRSYRRRGCVK